VLPFQSIVTNNDSLSVKHKDLKLTLVAFFVYKAYLD